MNLKNYVKEVLEIILEDYPSRFYEIRKLASNRKAIIRLEDESILVQISNRKIKIKDVGRIKNVNIETSLTRKIVLDLLDGKVTLDNAIQSSELDVRGDPESLQIFHRVIEIVLSAAPGSARIASLLRQFRNSA